MVDLFGVFIPKLRNTIKALYKEELVRQYEAKRTIKKRNNLYFTVYNMDVVLLQAVAGRTLSSDIYQFCLRSGMPQRRLFQSFLFLFFPEPPLKAGYQVHSVHRGGQ